MDKKEAKKEIKKPHLSKEAIILIAYFAVIIVIILPTKTVSYQVETIYQDTETYIDVEPYEIEESYTTKEAYVSEETYQDSIPISRDVPYEEEQYYYEKVEEPDCDTHSNCFCQGYGFVGIEYKCITCACQKTKTVTKYRTEVEYEKVSKTRPVTKYRDVVKTRTVTKYRDVNKTRTIAKVKTETRQKNVNWLLGFAAPWKLNIFS